MRGHIHDLPQEDILHSMKAQGVAAEVQSQGVVAGVQSGASLLPHIRDQGAAVVAQLGGDLLLGDQVEAPVVVEAGVLIPMIIQGTVPRISKICREAMMLFHVLDSIISCLGVALVSNWVVKRAQSIVFNSF